MTLKCAFRREDFCLFVSPGYSVSLAKMDLLLMEMAELLLKENQNLEEID